MKKVLVVLSLICFVAVNISKAQTAPVAKQEVKKEVTAVAKADDKAMPAGCAAHKAGCCKSKDASAVKNCTPAEKAACNHGDKAKAEATTAPEKKTDAKANGN